MASYDGPGLSLDQSVHLIPRAKLLAVLTESRDELRLYPADLDAALDRLDRDYLLFTSTFTLMRATPGDCNLHCMILAGIGVLVPCYSSGRIRWRSVICEWALGK